MILSMNFGRNMGVTQEAAMQRFKKYSSSYDLLISEDIELNTYIPCQKSLHKITYNTGGNKCDKILANIKKTKSLDKSKINDIEGGIPILGFPAALEYSTNKSANFYNIINYETQGDEDLIGYEKYPYVTMPIIQYAEDIILTTTENDHPTYLVVIKDHQSVIKAVTNKKKNAGCPNPVAHNKFILPLVFLAQNQLCYAVYALKKNSIVYISNRLYFFTINTDKVVETRQKIIWNITMTTSITCCTCSNLFIDERRCIYCNFIIFKNMPEHLKIHKICLFCNKETIPLNEHYTVYHGKKNKYIEDVDMSTTVINFNSSKSPATSSKNVSSDSSSDDEDQISNISEKYENITNETKEATNYLENMANLGKENVSQTQVENLPFSPKPSTSQNPDVITLDAESSNLDMESEKEPKKLPTPDELIHQLNLKKFSKANFIKKSKSRDQNKKSKPRHSPNHKSDNTLKQSSPIASPKSDFSKSSPKPRSPIASPNHKFDNTSKQSSPIASPNHKSEVVKKPKKSLSMMKMAEKMVC